MAVNNLNLSELQQLAIPEAIGKARKFAAERHSLNGESAVIHAEIAKFEQQHGFSSDELTKRLNSGTIEETLDVCRWLMLLRVKGHLADAASR